MSTSTGAHQPQRVLVAEDDPAIGKLVRILLTREGLEMLHAVDGPGALQLGMDHLDRIALAIIDQELPGKAGLDVAAELRRARPDLPVLIMSGYGRHDLHGDDLSFGFIAKPFVPTSFIESVRAALDGD